MICPNCGKENMDGSMFCVDCGADLLNVSSSDNLVQDDMSSQSGFDNTQSGSYQENSSYTDLNPSEYGNSQDYNQNQNYANNQGYSGAQGYNANPNQSYANSQGGSYQSPNQGYQNQGYQNPTYQNNTGANYNKNIYSDVDETPITPWGYVGYMLLFTCVPCAGLILMFVYAFGAKTNINLKNFARGMLILYVICIILYVILMVIAFAAGIGMSDLAEHNTYTYNSL